MKSMNRREAVIGDSDKNTVPVQCMSGKSKGKNGAG